MGITERKTVPTLKAFALDFISGIEVRNADKPETIRFYKANSPGCWLTSLLRRHVSTASTSRKSKRMSNIALRKFRPQPCIENWRL